MNKSLLIVASLALGTTALAQTNPAADPNAAQSMQPGATQAPADQGAMPSDPSQAQPATPPAGGDPSMSGGAMPGGTTGGATDPSMGGGAAGGMSGQPGQAGDMSGGAGAGSGAMMGNAQQVQQQAAQTNVSNLPRCSKTVKDSCVQAQPGAGKSMRKVYPHGANHGLKRHRVAKRTTTTTTDATTPAGQ